jgi:hypothetical protein
LSRETGFVTLRREDAAAGGEGFFGRKVELGKIRVHLPADALDEVRLVSMIHFIKLGR